MKNPGQRIKEEREAKNWSQQRLAEEISRFKKKRITRAAVAQWENGDSKTQKPENLFAAADVLGLTPQWVQFGTGEKYAAAAKNLSVVEPHSPYEAINNGEIETSTIGLTQEQQHILSVMEAIGPEARKALLQTASLIAKSNQSVVTDAEKPHPKRGVITPSENIKYPPLPERRIQERRIRNRRESDG